MQRGRAVVLAQLTSGHALRASRWRACRNRGARRGRVGGRRADAADVAECGDCELPFAFDHPGRFLRRRFPGAEDHDRAVVECNRGTLFQANTVYLSAIGAQVSEVWLHANERDLGVGAREVYLLPFVRAGVLQARHEAHAITLPADHDCLGRVEGDGGGKTACTRGVGGEREVVSCHGVTSGDRKRTTVQFLVATDVATGKGGESANMFGSDRRCTATTR